MATSAKQLVIVESPSKAKTIGKYLGADFHVVASVGHVRDLPKSNKAAIDIPAGFIPKYTIVAGKEKIIQEIKRLAKGTDTVYLATDPDREGEAIAWHIAEAVGLGTGKSEAPNHKPRTKASFIRGRQIRNSKNRNSNSKRRIKEKNK